MKNQGTANTDVDEIEKMKNSEKKENGGQKARNTRMHLQRLWSAGYFLCALRPCLKYTKTVHG